MSEGSVTLRRGSLYLDRALCDRCFAGLDAIVLLRRDDDLLIAPVRHAGAGGTLLKYRNSAGDRVAHASEFFRQHGIGDDVERDLGVRWVEDYAALVVKAAFCLKT